MTGTNESPDFKTAFFSSAKIPESCANGGSGGEEEPVTAECPGNCSTCTTMYTADGAEYSTCDECDQTQGIMFYLIENVDFTSQYGYIKYQCIDSCYAGQFVNDSSRQPVCTDCHEACTECYGADIGNCTACAEGYFKADGKDGCKPDGEGDESTETLDCVDDDQCLISMGIFAPCVA